MSKQKCYSFLRITIALIAATEATTANLVACVASVKLFNSLNAWNLMPSKLLRYASGITILTYLNLEVLDYKVLVFAVLEYWRTRLRSTRF